MKTMNRFLYSRCNAPTIIYLKMVSHVFTFCLLFSISCVPVSKVKIKNVTNGMIMEYTLVAATEADLKLKKISIDSPIGKGLLGKSVGQTAEIKTPNGILKFEIIEINR